MAYQTGAAATPGALLDTIKVFAETTLGWTVSFHGNDPQGSAGNAKWLSLVTPGGNYFNIISDISAATMSVRGATGYTSNSNRNSQPGQGPVWSMTNMLSGPFAAYYLFGGATYLHVVVEVVTNRFAHFHIGVLEKAGTYTGGEYQNGTAIYLQPDYQNDPESYYSVYPFDSYTWPAISGLNTYSAVRMDTDGAVNTWYSNANSLIVSPAGDASQCLFGFMRSKSSIATLMNRSPNNITAQSILLPSIIVGPRPAGGAAIYGTVKDLRPINIDNIAPKEVLTIGSDDWMVFPVTRKGLGTRYDIQSGKYGLAYRKVT